ncbi:uncharacterized protein LY89DRAFT_661113 [Mollisia scopiformis]|uniref:Zn(2)-C6 fungal-type domain-containing protein n=1 Tax=Mollisia scopiformis TaxID=149040 RepID=A0A132B3K4_MOLSC|nr:uncharacterized protein LY89DRAFT_661113 [Mollisia scopiformis]KUJ06962.1 hypothetical protein LY89DRAFT_661113 [Mollisia scopiformis]
MQSSTLRRDHSYTSLGERRGKSDLARFSLDLSWARAVSDSARSRAYPSPPMSGSPPLPPRRNPESSDRGHGSYGSSGQDVYRGIQTPQMEHAEQQRGPLMRGYVPDQGPSMPYPGPYSLANMPHAQMQYQPQLPQMVPQPQQQQQQLHGYAPHPPQPPAPFSTPDRPPISQTSEFTSPKQQRKTKGHVASACVPCKRAHLRQRPCSRCLSNGKEDACVDVQHKKRGRPRLRDEREPRFEGVGQGYPQHPEASMRRPLSSYNPSDQSGFSDTMQRSNSYRVLKSQGGGPMGGPMAPRYLDHASAADANIYGAPMPLTARMGPSQEPACAYLNLEMQIVKATPSFGETIGVPSVYQRKLQDIVSPNDRDKVARLQRIFEDERREREPNILPPIYLVKFEDDRVIQSLGFGPEEMGQPRADKPEMFTFHAPDGQQRTFQIRMGLAKKESTYYIVLQIHVPPTQQQFPQQVASQYPQDSWSRDSQQQYGYQTPQQSFAPNPALSPFTATPGFGDPRGDMTAYRTPGPLGANIPQSASMSYAQAPPRQDYPQGQTPYQTPRSELQQTQPQRQHDLQLPPIRDQRGESSSGDPMRRRDDRSGRVDIGGLLENPDRSRRGPGGP